MQLNLSPTSEFDETDTFSNPKQPKRDLEKHDREREREHLSTLRAVKAGRRVTRGGKVGRWKVKGKDGLNGGEGGECYLLNLPGDVLHLLLSRLPPHSLLTLSATCKYLNDELREDTLWRQSYVNRFLWDGAAREPRVKEEVKVLVQGCLNVGMRGWKVEGLSREAMIGRWTGSKATPVTHHPTGGRLLDAISLSYPVNTPTPKLIVGKNHQTPNRATTPSPNSSPNLNSTPLKPTHREKYEALLAKTTRPPPFLLSASLITGGIVRSDPLTTKVSKGFWGPGRESNFNVHPRLDANAEPSAIYVSPRDQTHVLWGLVSGDCVHTTILSKPHTSRSGASSLNIRSDPADSHDGDVLDIWTPDDLDKLHWVTAGSDGRVKYWQLHPPQNLTPSGKRSPNGPGQGSITCLFTSGIPSEPLPNRSELSRMRQRDRPDDMIFARCSVEKNVVCGSTADGDLRLWFGIGTGQIREVRIDAGSAEDFGEVSHLCLDAWHESNASVLVAHSHSPTIQRFDIYLTDADPIITSRKYTIPSGAAVNSLQAQLIPSPQISLPPEPVESLDGEEEEPPRATETFGRFITAGGTNGDVCIWAWDGKPEPTGIVPPLREWDASSASITAIDVSCGVVALGTAGGQILVYDPLPTPPQLLRSFHANTVQTQQVQRQPGFAAFPSQIILENDLVISSLGSKIFNWKAGSGKGRQDGKKTPKRSAEKGQGKFHGKGLDLKEIQRDVVDSREEMMSTPTRLTVPSRHERDEREAMDDLGLEGDEALQYALMLSMEDRGSPMVGEEEEEEVDSREEEELREALEMIRVQEESERAQW